MKAAVLRIHDILGVDPDPDLRIHASAVFIIDLQDASKKLNF
jgi:hypothetical protein